jgi:acyl carrier protein
MTAHSKLEEMVLRIHRRNGGNLSVLDFSMRLLDPSLRLDSLDLAEIMVAVENDFGISPFDSPVPPKTWNCLLALVGDAKSRFA